MRRSRRYRLFLFLFLFLLLVFVSLFLWQKWIESLAGPSTSRQQLIGQTSSNFSPPATIGDFQGQYFQLKLPTGTKLIDNERVGTDDKALETLTFDLTSPRLVVTITVYDAGRIGVAKLADFASVRYRQISTELYTSDQQDLAGYPAMLFFKQKEGAETTAFWLIKGKLYSLAVSSDYSVPEVDLVFSQLIADLTLTP